MKTSIKELRAEQAQCVTRQRAILTTAEAAGRDLNPSEAAEAAKIDDRLDELDADLVNAQTDADRRKRLASLGSHENGTGSPRAHLSGSDYSGSKGGAFAYRDMQTGASIQSVGVGQSIGESRGIETDRETSIGGIVAGMVGGWRPGMEREKAILQTGQDTAGGVLLPTAVSANVIDLARAKMVMNTAGARFIDMPAASEFHIAKVTADPTAVWRHEGTNITSSRPTFDMLILRPRTLAALCFVTEELLQDAANSAEVIESTISNALAQALDAAALAGASGGAEPTGVRETSDVLTTAVGGAWDYDDIAAAQQLIMAQNGPAVPTAVILSPASETARRGLKESTTLAYLKPPTWLDGVPFLVTTTCATSDIYQGDFSRVLMGVRSDFRVDILPAGVGTDAAGAEYNATAGLGRWIRVWGRFDVHVEQATHLHYMSGVTN